jgi:hypothetical protein
MPETDEGTLVDAKLEAVDRLLEELQRRRNELQEAREATATERKNLQRASLPLLD